MSPTTENRLSAAMHEAARDLKPPPGLAAEAISQSRRSRHRIVAGLGAVVIGAMAATTLLPRLDGPEVADGTLVVAPDWSGCAARLPLVNDNLGHTALDSSASAVEVAVCGPVVPGDGGVTMNVYVAASDDAQRIAERVLDSNEGTLTEGCLYETTCITTYFAIRMTDGSVARLAVVDLGQGAIVTDAATSRVDAKQVLTAVQGVKGTAPWHTYHSGDTPPPPLASRDFECPDDVFVEDWRTYVASPEQGVAYALNGPIDRVVICAYRPVESADNPVRVLVGIELGDHDATDLITVIEAAPTEEEPENSDCPTDTGLAYVIMAGSGETWNHVLYAQAYGCRIAGEVTPNPADDVWLTRRVVTDEVAVALLAAVGPENVQ